MIWCAEFLRNNISSILTAPISETDTQIQVKAGEGSKFPSQVEDFYLVLFDENRCAYEIVKLKSVSGDTLTVERAQLNTRPNSFPIGSKVFWKVSDCLQKKILDLNIAGVEYIHYQIEESNEWVIDHSLNCYPEVIVLDTEGNFISGFSVEHESAIRLKIKFSEPTKGYAVISKAKFNISRKVSEHDFKITELIQENEDLKNKFNEIFCLMQKMISTIAQESTLTPEEILKRLKNVDGSGSGLDADLLDGKDSSEFALKDLSNVDLDRLIEVISQIPFPCEGEGFGDFIKTDFSNFDREKFLEIFKAIDGSGSGVDADLLDGKEAEDFAFNDLSNVNPQKLLQRLLMNEDFTGLDADTLDGHDSTFFAYSDLSNVPVGVIVDKLLEAGYLVGGDSVDVSKFARKDLSNVNSEDILLKLIPVDGSGSGLDADLLDGYDASHFAFATLENVNNETILNKLKNVDGSGSGLDADKVDGYETSQTSAPHVIVVTNENGKIDPSFIECSCGQQQEDWYEIQTFRSGMGGGNVVKFEDAFREGFQNSSKVKIITANVQYVSRDYEVREDLIVPEGSSLWISGSLKGYYKAKWNGYQNSAGQCIKYFSGYYIPSLILSDNTHLILEIPRYAIDRNSIEVLPPNTSTTCESSDCQCDDSQYIEFDNVSIRDLRYPKVYEGESSNGQTFRVEWYGINNGLIRVKGKNVKIDLILPDMVDGYGNHLYSKINISRGFLIDVDENSDVEININGNGKVDLQSFPAFFCKAKRGSIVKIVGGFSAKKLDIETDSFDDVFFIPFDFDEFSCPIVQSYFLRKGIKLKTCLEESEGG